MPSIYTGGTFDMFHPGHIELFKYCRMLANGSTVTVGLNTDEFIIRYKKRAPIMNYWDRFDMIESCKYVDQIIENTGGEDSRPAILEVKAEMVVIGMDWLDKDYPKQMGFDSEWLNKNKIMLTYVPRTTRWSTTHIKHIVLE